MEREPQVIDIAQQPEDEFLRKQTNTLIGEVLLKKALQVEYVDEQQVEIQQTTDLASALERARTGDEEAESLVRANVCTDYFERAYKYGFVSEVEIKQDDNGRLMQHGQSLYDVHLNSLLYIQNIKLRERAKIEALNSLRDQYFAENGMLRDYVRVVFSHVHDGMSDQEADGVGFFTRTKSLSMQLLTQNSDDTFVMQSAFVAGREHALSDSFDKQSVAKIAESLGVSYANLDSEEILARPLLVHKSLLPEGVLSLVERYDVAASRITGIPKFFGKDAEARLSQSDYVAKKQENERQMQRMNADIEVVVQQLKCLGKMTATEATTTLSKLNDALIKSKIIHDASIDASVLGVEAAYYVEHARSYVSMGLSQHSDVALLQQKIARVGVSSSCPSGGSRGSEFVDNMSEVDSANDSDDTVPEDCDFISKECPKCGEKNVKTSCRKGVYYGECGCKSS